MTDQERHRQEQILRDQRANLRARAEAWDAMGMQLRDIVREGATQAVFAAVFAERPHLRAAYDRWTRELSKDVPPTGTKSTQRHRMYARAAAARKEIPLHDRDLPEEQLRERYPQQAEVLRDVAWRLRMLRGKPAGLTPWQETDEPRKLREWVRRLSKQLFDARMAGHAARAAELDLEMTRCSDKLKCAEIDEYELKMAAWRVLVGDRPLRNRPREPRSKHYRLMHAGGRRGRPPNATDVRTEHEVPKRPHRPRWMIDEDEANARAAKEEQQTDRWRRTLIPIDLLPPTPHADYLERAVQRSQARTARAAARKQSHLDAACMRLCDWVWGEARLMHVGLPVEVPGEGTWMYFDFDRIPHASTWQAAPLAACAVRLSTGWAFPPATARGRK